jgi:Flp pilus assembly protein TadD
VSKAADARVDFAADAVAEAITVTAQAPATVPPPATMTVPFPSEGQRRVLGPTPPPPNPPVIKRADENWTRNGRPTRDDIGRLRDQLRNDPRNRTLYNALSDAMFINAEWRGLRELAIEWQPYDADNPQVYESLGFAAERLGRNNEAERAYASLIELATGKPELLQRAGLLLVRVGGARLAETPLRRALELRPDRVNAYRHLALMLWLDGRPDEAAAVLESALRQSFPGWYGNVHRVVREELAYVYRSWGAKTPGDRATIEDHAQANGVNLSTRDAIRVTLTWETDANDVDLHVVDPEGLECFYGNRRTSSGMELYEDITQGLGPEVIRSDRAPRGTYHVGVRYFAAGPMGVSRGVVVIMTGREGREPSVEVVPFRLMEGGAPIRHVASIEVK